jgi:CRP-like cAMP-binding protein
VSGILLAVAGAGGTMPAMSRHQPTTIDRSTDVDPLAAVAACPIFGTVPRRRLAELASTLGVRRFPAHTWALRQGDPCPGILVVAHGSVRVLTLAPSGKQHLLRVVAAPGSLLAVSVAGGYPCPACIETLEPTTLVLVPTAAVRQLMTQEHAFCHQLVAMLAHRAHELTDLLTDIVLRDATARLAHHLLTHCAESGHMRAVPAWKDLALHLNLTPETVSRSLRRLERAGFLQHAGTLVRVRDRAGLEAVAAGVLPTG